MQIEDLHFSVRIYHCLKRAGIDTVEQLSRMTDDELMHLRGFGVGCLAEVRAKIAVPIKTNADSIRAMSDEELAVFLSDDNRICPPRHPNCGKYINACTGCFFEWLQKPAED